MKLTEQQKNQLSEIGSRLLDVLDQVANHAHVKLSGKASGQSSYALAGGTNMMVDGAAAQMNLSAINLRDREDLRRLESEPFIARLVVRWENEDPAREETLYISRASVANMDGAAADGKLATYGSIIGRLAEFDVGESVTLKINGRECEAYIRERVRLHPVRSEGRWDAVNDSFEFDEPWRAAVESVLQLLEHMGRPALKDEEVPDLIGALLEQDAEARLIRDALRRGVIEHMALRDQPILDQYQGEVFRLPLNRRLVLLGPPGTGKTTTLIRRLAQKRTPDALLPEEMEVLEAAGVAEAFRYSDNWAMFSPTELLKLYLRDAFNREGVPAGDGNLRTWDRERLDLARNVLRILRSAEGGLFRLDDGAELLSDSSGAGVSRLYEEFSAHFRSEVLDRIIESYEQLLRADDNELRRRAAAAVGRRRSEGALSVREVANLLDHGSQLQPEAKRLDDEINKELNSRINRLLFDHRELLGELVEAMPLILGDDRREDEEDEDEEDEDEDSALPQAQELRSEEELQRAAVKILRSTLRSLARASARGRSMVRGRAGRVVKLLGDRVPPRESLVALGALIVTRAHIRTVMRAPRLLVMGAPKSYARFRRQALKQGQLFRADVGDQIRQRRISPAEVDALILTMLHHARLLIEASPASLSGRTQDWLENIKSKYLMQVFVDEMTDFSLVQLACTMELAHPRLRSWFACGDLDQRITAHGIRTEDEISRLNAVTGDEIDRRRVKRVYRQSPRLLELVVSLSTRKDEDEEDAGRRASGEAADIWPLLAEHHTGEHLADWLADRISEVERSVGGLPSIAIFVDGEEQIDQLVRLVRPRLEERNIRIVPCKDGRVVGDRQEVRVFDVQHVKGLEFEGVFFVGIDRLAKRLPELFDRFFFVGASRAATYLGVTCDEALPAELEQVRGHFGKGGW